MTRSALSARVAHARANPLEYVLLTLAFVAIGVAMYETVAVALHGDRTQDLTFSGTTAELGRTLSSNGSARIGRLERATIVVGGDTAVADTHCRRRRFGDGAGVRRAADSCAIRSRSTTTLRFARRCFRCAERATEAGRGAIALRGPHAAPHRVGR